MNGVQVGQRFRDDSGYVMDIIAILDNGNAWVRHPNQKQGGMEVISAWFKRWERIR